MSIAKELDGKRVDGFNGGHFKCDMKTGIYTFPDKSQAVMITEHEETAPYVTASLATATKKPYKVWKCLS